MSPKNSNEISNEPVIISIVPATELVVRYSS